MRVNTICLDTSDDGWIDLCTKTSYGDGEIAPYEINIWMGRWIVYDNDGEHVDDVECSLMSKNKQNGVWSYGFQVLYKNKCVSSVIDCLTIEYSDVKSCLRGTRIVEIGQNVQITYSGTLEYFKNMGIDGICVKWIFNQQLGKLSNTCNVGRNETWQKYKFCHFYPKNCRFGKKCRYIHVTHEMKKLLLIQSDANRSSLVLSLISLLAFDLFVFFFFLFVCFYNFNFLVTLIDFLPSDSVNFLCVNYNFMLKQSWTC